MLKKSVFAVFCSLICACASKPTTPTAGPRDDAQTPYLGVELGGLAMGPNVPQVSALDSIIFRTVLINGPAWSAGFRPGDAITKINKKQIREYNFRSPDDFKKYISGLNVGETLNFEIVRKSVSGELKLNGQPVKTLDGVDAVSALDFLSDDLAGGNLNAQWTVDAKKSELSLKLQGRTYGFGEVPPVITADFAKLFRAEDDPYAINTAERLKAVGDDAGISDLNVKLARLTESGDSLRPQIVSFLQRNPHQLQAATHWARRRLHEISIENSLFDSARFLGELSGQEIKEITSAKSKGAIQNLIASLKASKSAVNQAVSELTSFRVDRLKRELPEMAIRLIEYKYLQNDMKAAQIQKLTENFIDLTKIHQRDLAAAAAVLAKELNKPNFHKIKLQAAQLLKESGGKPVTLESELGPVKIFGKEDNRHLAGDFKDVALLIDLGGDDWYADIHCPIIDFEGNDIYEATGDFVTAASVIDSNFLVDLEGDDRYIGHNGSFGATLFGVALQWDAGGHDEVRCLTYCAAAALGGVAVYVDNWGDDRYEAQQLGQGLSAAGGAALLADLSGNDRYFAKGGEPSGYGDPGQFDGWSQGMALGLRGFVSGGIAFLYDREGGDRYEGGNFSQGGGYYFGWGALIDDGKENDVYITSRYGQGFSAHYAVGSFLDGGGNDQHFSRDAVAQGMAWDMSLTLFEDFEGNDTYRTCEHCLGVASNNSIALFIDHSGDDTYLGKDLPLDADVENNYHSGISLGLFLDRSGSDTYEKMKNHSSMTRKKYHLVIDE